MLVREPYAIFLGKKACILQQTPPCLVSKFSVKNKLSNAVENCGIKGNGEYFWPVNIPMDASHFRGNIKLFHATTRPDRFLFVNNVR